MHMKHHLTKESEGIERTKMDVFVHLPKCGGKSLEQLLIQNYGKTNMIRIYRPGKQPIDSVLPRIPLRKRKTASLMYGYIPYGTGEKIGRTSDYFTVLRDSTSRFLSFYRFVKYDFVSHPLHQPLKNGLIGINDLCSRNHFSNIANVMTKLIAGYETRDREQSCMLQKAKDNLDHMPAFGIMEYYEESIDWLASTFKWESKTLEAINVSSVKELNFEKGDKVGCLEVQRIREMNWMDEELYFYAKKKFLEERSLRLEGN